MLSAFHSLTKGSNGEESLTNKFKHFIRKNKYTSTLYFRGSLFIGLNKGCLRLTRAHRVRGCSGLGFCNVTLNLIYIDTPILQGRSLGFYC
jgi:hypothetical protein